MDFHIPGSNLPIGSFMDLENTQVLKGPQGTLFGRNTTGGAVILVPKKPTDKLEGYVEATAGDYDLMRGQAVLNLPLADTFKVLGDTTRVRILDALSRSPELCVHDLAARVGITESAVSHQLRLLRGMRLVRPRRDGRLVYYSLDDQHIVGLFEQGLEHVEERARGASRALRHAQGGPEPRRAGELRAAR